MGLGSAIIELKQNAGNNGKYREAVLYACTRDTCFDAQTEDGRQYYLYEAIDLVGGNEYFLKAIIARMKTADAYNLVAHLAGLLYVFWDKGYNTSGTAIQEKFNDCLSKIIRIRNMDKHRLFADTLTLLTLWLCDIYGIKGFYSCAEQIGQALRKCPDKDIITLIWLIPNCKDKFGSSFIERFEKKALKSDGVRVLFDKWKQEDYDDRHGLKEPRTIRPEPALDEVMLLAADGQRMSRRKLFSIGARISGESSSELRLEIARKIDESDEEDIKARLMTVFSRCDYPYSVEKLLLIYERSANDLKAQTLKAMARFTDKHVHAIAVKNLAHGVHIVESMGLLINNFDDDYDLVYNVQKSLTSVRDHENYHGIAMSIRDIFKGKRDKNALKILLHCYHNCRCSFCRNSIVEIMCKHKIIPDNILEECLYDCVWDTRKLARKYNLDSRK
ncbi:MAG: hypothetical protein LBQ42_02750 [Synergistaceae bacterium]|jgi:hypothetical protein|nr:hypothetical protein [Synergistaceae bacterium]